MLVVDDHSLVREGTRTILERDPRIEVVGEAPDGETAVAMADTLAPDVVLMDIGLSGMTGLEATRASDRTIRTSRFSPSPSTTMPSTCSACSTREHRATC